MSSNNIVIKIGSKITDDQNTEYGTIQDILFEESKHIIAVNNFGVHALNDGDEIFFTKDDVRMKFKYQVIFII